MRLIIFCLVSFYTVLFANELNYNLCVNKNNYQICPNKDLKVVNTLSIIKKDNLSEQKTQISFDNIQVLSNSIKFFIVPEFEGYMTIININPNGEKKQFFPNELLSDDYVKKGQLIDLSYKNNSIKTSYLEYFIVIITSERVYFSISEKNAIYDAYKDEKIFNEILTDIQTNKYGKYFLKILPYYRLNEIK